MEPISWTWWSILSENLQNNLIFLCFVSLRRQRTKIVSWRGVAYCLQNQKDETLSGEGKTSLWNRFVNLDILMKLDVLGFWDITEREACAHYFIFGVFQSRYCRSKWAKFRSNNWVKAETISFPFNRKNDAKVRGAPKFRRSIQCWV